MAVGLLAPLGAGATELKLADQFPATHVITKSGTQAFLDHVNNAEGVDLKITHYPAEQLGKANAMLDLAQNRVADIAMVGISYIAEKMPLSGLMELPGLFDDVFAGSEAFDRMARKEFAELEYNRHGVRLVSVLATPQYQLLLRRPDPIASLQDLNGLKVRVAGSTSELVARSIGLVPVKMAAPDLYVALERGTLDGAIYTLSALSSYKLDEVTSSYTANAALGSVAFATFINEDVWQSLTDAQQRVLMEGGKKATFAIACAMFKEEQRVKQALTKQGKQVYDLPEAVAADMAAHLQTVEDEWVRQMSQRGLPAEETLATFKAYVDEVERDGSAEAAKKRCLAS